MAELGQGWLEVLVGLLFFSLSPSLFAVPLLPSPSHPTFYLFPPISLNPVGGLEIAL